MSEPTYDCVIERGHNPINDSIIDFLKTKIKGRYLDVGANTGWLLREVPNGVGVDASQVMVEKSNGLVQYARAEQLPFSDGEFDTVVLSCVLEQCENWEAALEEARRVGRKVIGINPIPGSRWGTIWGWVKCIIPREAFPYTDTFDSERYYFEVDGYHTPERRIVYTSIVNNFDSQRTQGILNITKDIVNHPRRSNRYWKTHPPEAEYSLYIDGNMLLYASIDELIEEYLQDADMAMFPHPDRNCIYDEAIAARGLDIPETIRDQMERYEQEGFPKRFGLHAGGFILRRHTEAVKRFNEMWWNEIANGSRRDQLSFDYVRWKTGMKVNHFKSGDYWANDYYKYYGHG